MTALRFEADYSGLTHFTTAECVVEVEVVEDKVIEVPDNSTTTATADNTTTTTTEAGAATDSEGEKSEKKEAEEKSEKKEEAAADKGEQGGMCLGRGEAALVEC